MYMYMHMYTHCTEHFKVTSLLYIYCTPSLPLLEIFGTLLKLLVGNSPHTTLYKYITFILPTLLALYYCVNAHVQIIHYV